jgi:hypothetical protein
MLVSIVPESGFGGGLGLGNHFWRRKLLSGQEDVVFLQRTSGVITKLSSGDLINGR